MIETTKLDDIRKVVVATSDDGTPIYVRQLAQVIVGNRPRLGMVGRTVPETRTMSSKASS